jgi:hypothetical protein
MAKESELSHAEIAKLRDAALLRALSTPHKRQAEMKIGNLRTKRSDGASPKKRGRDAPCDSNKDRQILRWTLGRSGTARGLDLGPTSLFPINLF